MNISPPRPSSFGFTEDEMLSPLSPKTARSFASSTHSTSWRHRVTDMSFSSPQRHAQKEIDVKAESELIKIKSVADVYKAVWILVRMLSNCWTGFATNKGQAYQQVNPGLVKVHVGSDVHLLPGFLLQDMESMCTQAQAESEDGEKGAAASFSTNPTMMEVTLKMYTPYFKHMILLLKLRWLLRLHSACCELDYKMCSCANLIKGLQHVSLQQCTSVDSDSVFDRKVNTTVGAHINMESVVDDIFDQLQRSLGAIGWRSFIEFTSTCDPTRSVHHSRMDMGPITVVSNFSLMTIIDTIFVASFLRQARESTGCDLKGLYDDLNALGVPEPQLPPFRAAQNLRIWYRSKMGATRADKELAASKTDLEKLAQLDAVLLCAALELEYPEILATPEDLLEMQVTDPPKGLQGDVAPELFLENTGRATSSSGPAAARATLVDKPQASPAIFNSIVNVVHHHVTFPHGIRERMYKLMTEVYGLSKEQGERLAIALMQNIDGQRLCLAEMINMQEREKTRLRNHEVSHSKDCAHLLLPPLVSSPSMRSMPAPYTRGSAPTALGNLSVCRSMPDLRSTSRDPFKVPLSTGPLTVDPELHKLRSTGFFIKMPHLKP